MGVVLWGLGGYISLVIFFVCIELVCLPCIRFSSSLVLSLKIGRIVRCHMLILTLISVLILFKSH